MSDSAHRFDNAKRRRGDGHDRQRMLTPAYALEPIRAALRGISLDPCTEPDNPTRAAHFYSPPADGAAESWDFPSVFCNPPYGEARERWVRRCIDEGKRRRVALLIPSHTETRIFQEALGSASATLFFRARLMFGAVRKNGRHEAASHGSALFLWGDVDLAPIEPLGVILTAERAKGAALEKELAAYKQAVDECYHVDPSERLINASTSIYARIRELLKGEGNG